MIESRKVRTTLTIAAVFAVSVWASLRTESALGGGASIVSAVRMAGATLQREASFSQADTNAQPGGSTSARGSGGENASGSGSASAGSASAESEKEFYEALAEETNRVRRARGLRALTLENDLALPARSHARDMLARDYFAHASPEGDAPVDRVQKLSPRAIVLGVRENIAKVEGNVQDPILDRARDLIHQWLGSPGHRENLLNDESTGVGFGSASASRDRGDVEVTVQVFGIVAGRWEEAPGAVLPTSARWRGTFFTPLEFFLDDVSRPHSSYRDPRNSSMFWTGGLPLVVVNEPEGAVLQIPRMKPGPYRILARRAGEGDYQELRKIEIR